MNIKQVYQLFEDKSCKVFTARGSRFVREGTNFYTLCPFHKEKTGSMCLYRTKGRLVLCCYSCQKRLTLLRFLTEQFKAPDVPF